jgi:bifunctional non-homologous end joining protein LigD
MVAQDVLEEHGLRGYPKTSGSKGIHVFVRIEPRWDYYEVRRAALALARAVERRAPDRATSRWWKEERHGVFVDYNQNARDRTVASAYSVRPTPDARVSCPLDWGRGAQRRAPRPAAEHGSRATEEPRGPGRGHRPQRRLAGAPAGAR